MESQGITLPVTACHPESSDKLAAFERIMARSERSIVRVALRLLNNAEDAQDAAQEVFLRLYKHFGSLDETLGYEPWLFRVTVNVCRDIARSRRRVVALERAPDPASLPAAPGEIERAQQRELVRRALSRLGEKERAAIVLRDVEGFSTREVAGILGSSEATVRSQISTGRLKMREFVGRWLRRQS